MSYYLWEMRPYSRQVAGQMVLGSLAGIMMNTAVVLPAILLGRAIDAALAFERGEVGSGAVYPTPLWEWISSGSRESKSLLRTRRM